MDGTAGTTVSNSGPSHLRAPGTDLGRISTGFINPIQLDIATATGGNGSHNNVQPTVAALLVIKT